jgi:hypothetical protein
MRETGILNRDISDMLGARAALAGPGADRKV